MDKRKTGIALFITLMVIASIMSIIAVSFSYLEKVQKDAGATAALIQANILYGNTLDILNRFFPEGADNTKKLGLLYTMPLVLQEEESGFLLNMNCEALMTGAPIAWLEEEAFPKTPAKHTLVKEILEYIVDLYAIEDPQGLEETLLEAITGKTLETKQFEPRLKKQKGIISKQQFYQVIMDYSLKYNDRTALSVPWEKYFSFVKVTKKTKIDGSYPSAEFVSAAFDIPVDIVKDGWINDVSIGQITTLSSFLNDNSYSTPLDKNIYSKKAMNAMHCEERFTYNDRQYTFKFNYIKGRSSNFEFNGQQ